MSKKDMFVLCGWVTMISGTVIAGTVMIDGYIEPERELPILLFAIPPFTLSLLAFLAAEKEPNQ